MIETIPGIEMIRSIYGNELPLLNDAYVCEIKIDGFHVDQLWIKIVFASEAKKIPLKWKRKGYNKFGVYLSCVNMSKFEISLKKSGIHYYKFNAKKYGDKEFHLEATPPCGSYIKAIGETVCFDELFGFVGDDFKCPPDYI